MCELLVDPPNRNAVPQEIQPIRVMILGSDGRIVSEIRSFFERYGIAVAWSADTQAGLEEALRTRPEVLLVDLDPAGAQGAELCRWIRLRCDLPVILITAEVDEADRVLGLESGADDCVSKPLALRELLARVRVQVRRLRGPQEPNSRVLHVGALRIDPRAMHATLGGRMLNLTTYEFKLLYGLAERAGRVLSREQLMNLVRGNSEEAFDRSIDSHVSRLRNKLGDDPRHPRMLKTVRGAGYLFAGAESTCDAE